MKFTYYTMITYQIQWYDKWELLNLIHQENEGNTNQTQFKARSNNIFTEYIYIYIYIYIYNENGIIGSVKVRMKCPQSVDCKKKKNS